MRAKSNVSAHDILTGHENIFIGAMTENYLANILQQNGYKLFYWSSGGQAEIDFLIKQVGDVVPIEVKAREHVRSRSLSVFNNHYHSAKSIRVSGKNFGYESGIQSIRLYAAWLI